MDCPRVTLRVTAQSPPPTLLPLTVILPIIVTINISVSLMLSAPHPTSSIVLIVRTPPQSLPSPLVTPSFLLRVTLGIKSQVDHQSPLVALSVPLNLLRNFYPFSCSISN